MLVRLDVDGMIITKSSCSSHRCLGNMCRLLDELRPSIRSQGSRVPIRLRTLLTLMADAELLRRRRNSFKFDDFTASCRTFSFWYQCGRVLDTEELGARPLSRRMLRIGKKSAPKSGYRDIIHRAKSVLLDRGPTKCGEG